jgi:hypothetical protein
VSQPKKKSIIVWTECQTTPKWTVWTGRIGDVECFSINPTGDFFTRNYFLDCNLPGERSGWQGSEVTLKRKAEKILHSWLTKANLKVNV